MKGDDRFYKHLTNFSCCVTRNSLTKNYEVLIFALMNAHQRLLTKQEEDYYLQRMDEVSRSFAIVVPQMEKPLDDYTGISYLLCRVADNIEDVEAPESFKLERFEEMIRMLDGRADSTEVLSEWEAHAWPGLTEDEQNLMTIRQGLMLWQIFNKFPARIKRHIGYWVSEMISGMAANLDPERSILKEASGISTLESVEAYNRYCYVVAGNVGHLLTRLTADFYGFSQHTVHQLLAYTEHFARTLQKTNILKDFGKDLSRGICYIPRQWMKSAGKLIEGVTMETRKLVLHDIFTELKGAVQYVGHIPLFARGYRMGALLCLLPAFETARLALENVEDTLTGDASLKISRDVMERCFYLAMQIAGDNEVLHRYYQEQVAMLKDTFQEEYSL